MKDLMLLYKYINLVGQHLEGFSKKRNSLYNFRCPYCGDGSNKSKKRGYFIKREDNWQFYCHNCSESKPFEVFLKEIDSYLYKEYKNEVFLSYTIEKKKEAPKEISYTKKWEFRAKNDLLDDISSFPKTHKSVEYLLNRKVSPENFKYIKWTNNFPKLISTTIGDKYIDSKLPREGIVFELYNTDKQLTGYQIRSIESISKKNRFVICSATEEHGFYKFNEYNSDKLGFVVEGCIDSLFLDNSVATLSASLYKLKLNNCIYINDCEPRNKEVCKQIEKSIEKGLKVCLLPIKYEGMDINDIVKKYRYSKRELEEIIVQNSYSGLTAKIKFVKWKK